MVQYQDLLRRILSDGHRKDDRTGTGTISLFGAQMRFDMSKGFPLVTTKKMFTRGIFEELLWFISGSTNARVLEDKNVNIWREWGDPVTRDLGPIYGKQWRDWEGADGSHHDQLMQVIEQIKTNPDSRRLIVSSWKVDEIERMALPPCHCFFQFYVCDGRLSLQLYQRSADMFLGVPFNIASYAALLMMVAQVTGLQPGTFVHTIGDAHIYLNHLAQVDELLSRKPLYLPKLWLNPEITDIRDFTIDDIRVEDYVSYEPIKAEVAV